MKQRCAILSCDYFSGGECQGLCALQRQRQPIVPADVPAPTRGLADLPPLPIDVAEPDPPSDDDRESMWLAVGLIAAGFVLSLVLFASKLGYLIWAA